ncbi:SEC7-like protein [Hesseltinella vesiculosa]|uniref:SEC7-like protein n=1 Tax=Hesseltinella vesiculosa TaxID=101127 RepID=A0A1X2GCA1_9FUNG|nr:SEC7-like protein [Hesseltinella vesiculosa]
MIVTSLPKRQDSLSRASTLASLPPVNPHTSFIDLTPKPTHPPIPGQKPLPVRGSSLSKLSYGVRPSTVMVAPPPLLDKPLLKTEVIAIGEELREELDDGDTTDTSSYLTAGDDDLGADSPVRPPFMSRSSSQQSCLTDYVSIIEEEDDSIESSLLQWKRQSTLQLAAPAMATLSRLDFQTKMNECLATLSTTSDLWADNAIFGELEIRLKQPTIQEKCQYAADRLWSEDTSLMELHRVAAFLGKNELFNHTVCQLFLAKFDFAHRRLDLAFRQFCAKVYLKAEAQEIDRILEAFAYRYWHCNQDARLLYNADVVYAVVYSLMLLNTDLHIAPGHMRMSKAHFCENTMVTILNNVKTEHAAYLPGGLTQWKQDLQQFLRDMYQSIKSQSIVQPQMKKSRSFLQRIDSFKLASQTKAGDKTQEAESKIKQGINVPELSSRVRWRTANKLKPSTQQDWVKGHLHLKRGCLRLTIEKTTSKFSSIIKPAMQRAPDESTWTIELDHCLLTSGTLNNSFELHLNNSSHYEIECQDASLADQWKFGVWFWAAMVSKKPWDQPVSSCVYGWEVTPEELDTCTLSVWEPPSCSWSQQTDLRGSQPSITLESQLKWIQQELSSLQQEHDTHSQRFAPIIQLPTRLHVKKAQILTNWHEKNTSLIQQMDKYTQYKSAIEKYQGQRRLLHIDQGNFLEEINDLFKEISHQ